MAAVELTPYQVYALWDAEAEVWVATSDDVPGLVTEAETIEALSDKLRIMIPELLRLNDVIAPDYVGPVVFQLTSQKQETVEVAA